MNATVAKLSRCHVMRNTVSLSGEYGYDKIVSWCIELANEQMISEVKGGDLVILDDSWFVMASGKLRKLFEEPDASSVPDVLYYIISDEAARTLAMKSGQVDIIVSPSVDMLSNLEEIPGVEILQADSLYDDNVAFNCMKAPFDDENFRKACAYAIDAVSIRESVYGEYAEDATGLPFGKAMYTVAEDVWNEAEGEMESYAYDLDKAKEYLAKSAYPDGTEYDTGGSY